MAKKKSQRTIVGSPLTPSLLKELGAVDKLPSTPKDFRPAGNWVNTYRIWTCHGYRESGNENVGLLRLERAAGKSDESFALKVHQKIVQTDGILNIIDARMRCLNDELASVVQWQLSSRLIGQDGEQRPELGTEEKVRINRDVMSVETGGQTFKRKVPTQLPCDWSLFEAVQRLKFKRESSLTFDLLEGLSLLKQDQHLSYGGGSQMTTGTRDVALHCFAQLGRGILPYEYWLDERHRLLLVTSMNKAYVLDEQAERIIGRT